MADIAKLGMVQSEPLNLDIYKDFGGPRPFPKKGRYTLRAPESFPPTSFTRSQAGALQAQIDPVIVGPTNEGFPLKFIRVSAKTYPRDGVPASKMGDYLRAFGRKGVINNDQELADAVEATANLTYEADLDWRLYGQGHDTDGANLIKEGMENFPSDGKGGYLPYIPSKTQTNPETGEPVMLRANVVIKRFVPVTS